MSLSAEQKKIFILGGLSVVLVILLVVLQGYRFFLGARVAPVPQLSESIVGGRLTTNNLPVGNNTLYFRARTTDGKLLEDVVNFTVAKVQPAVVHISYQKNGKSPNPDQLKYATNDSGSFITTVIDSLGETFAYDDLAVDSQGKIYISYSSEENGPHTVNYATNASGAWVTTVVAQVGPSLTNLQTSIAVDSNNKVHISYNDFVFDPAASKSFYDLKYATNASGSWVTSTVDATQGVGRYSSIAVDKNNHVHISYADLGQDQLSTPILKYATNTSGSWTLETIDKNAAGLGSSIKTDSNNKVHISYQGGPNLRYATNVSGNWALQTVDSRILSGNHNSLTLDSSNNAHISYLISNALQYATNISGNWVTALVDKNSAGGSTGEGSDIAVDGSGKAYISYYDYKEVAVKYATNVSGSWVSSIVDDVNGASGVAYTSIGLARP